MQLYSKEGLLFLVQVDHLTGETIGNAIESFYEAGAKNVQVVSSVTKKNRPAYMIFIDAAPAYAEDIEEMIVKELGSSGWHRLETTHRHTNVTITAQKTKIACEGYSFEYVIRSKVIDDDIKNARPEYDDVKAIKQRLYENAGVRISTAEISQSVVEMLHKGENNLSFISRR